MRKLKQILSMLLVVVLLVNLVPVDVFATPDNEPEATTESNMNIEGTNGFGKLISENLNDYQEELAYTGEYTVTELVVEGTSVTVTYDAKKEALLIVALYTDDGMQLLNSTQGLVQPEEKEATLTFEGEMPEHFRASAYLVESYDLSPLCEKFETPMYTSAMQELLDSTVEDYDVNRVWNLDNDSTTNFAVYEESTIVIPFAEGVNEVASADYENAIYVIENADENFTELQKGDIFVYHFGEEEVLVSKVKSIQVNGTVVTITGDDLEIKDVFSQMKLEAGGTTYDFTVDETTGDGSVTYLGRVDNEVQTYAVARDGILDNTETKRDWIQFDIEKEIYENDKGDSFKIYGTLESSYELEFTYYITDEVDYLSFTFDMEIDTHVGVEGEIEFAAAKFPYIGISPVPGLSFGFQMEAVFKSSGKVETHFLGAISVGVAYEDTNGFQNLCKKPLMESTMEIEGSLYLGLEFTPKMRLASGCLAELGIPIEYGFELSAKYTSVEGSVEDSDYPDEKHSCKNCLDGGLTGTLSIGAELKFFKCEWLTIGKSWDLMEVPLLEFYYSFDYKEGGFGGCPRYTYRQTIQLKDIEGKWIEGIPVSIDGRQEEELSDKYGTVSYYLPKGEYKLLALREGENYEKEIEVTEAQKIIFELISYEEMVGHLIGGGIFGGIHMEDITEINGEEVASGEYTKNENDIRWKIYDNGLLVIRGEGEITGTGSWGEEYTKYINDITKIIIYPGITGIGYESFYYYKNLISVQLPDTLETIGDRAFRECTALVDVQMPQTLDSIGGLAFYGCKNIIKMSIPEGVEVIKNSTFERCSSLVSVELPDTLSNIEDYAFLGCSNLETIVLPESVTMLGNSVFSGCTNLKSAVLPTRLNSMGTSVFANCSSLESIKIPEGITKVENQSFSQCTGLKEVILPTTVESIEYRAFYSCSSLEAINLPEGIKRIEQDAFSKCKSLKRVDLPSTVESIAQQAFYECAAIEGEIVIPEGITKIEGSTFAGCKKISKVTLPSTLQIIGGWSFNACSDLREINFPEGLTTIEAYAFLNCEKLKSVVLPATLNSLGDNTFKGCSSLSGVVNIPNGITKIGEYTFESCENLEEILLPSGLKSIGEYAFAKCDALKSVEIPEGVETVGDGAFYHCDSLTSVKIPGSLMVISFSMFHWCKSLCDVELAEGVTNIYSQAFSYCKGLTSIEFPASVETLSSCVLQASGSLTQSVNVRFRGPAPLIADLAFNDIEVIIDYPANDSSWTTEVMEEYEKHCTFAKIIWKSYTPFNILEIREDHTISTYASFPGEYGKEEIDDREIKTADFKNLVPGGQYLLLVLKSTTAENPVSAENLLYIEQGQASENGTLRFRYVQREDTDVSYVLVCGPSYKNLQNTVERISGATRYETSLKIADAYKENLGVSKFDAVIISCGTNFADALAGSYLASVKNAPILMYNNKTGKSNVETLEAYVEENLNAGGTVYLLGGTRAVGDDVTNALSEYEVKRLGGASRYDTNLAILEEAGVGNKDILVCTGQNFADSLSGSAAQMPILLVNNKKGELTDAQKEFMNSLSGNKLYVVGGTGAVSAELEKQLQEYGEVERIGGKTRYETSVMLAEMFFEKADAAVLALGKNFPDGLCGGMLAISMNAPLVLTISNSNASVADAYAQQYGIESGVVLGGSGLITDEVVRDIFNMDAETEIVLR